MQFYKIPVEKLLVICDDISLAPGRLRIRRKGSAGGHNGLKNIIYLLGRDDFARVKLGVGEKPHPDYDLADWVLGRFTKEQGEALEQACSHCDDIVRLFVAGRLDEAMNRASMTGKRALPLPAAIRSRTASGYWAGWLCSGSAGAIGWAAGLSRSWRSISAAWMPKRSNSPPSCMP